MHSQISILPLLYSVCISLFGNGFSPEAPPKVYKLSTLNRLQKRDALSAKNRFGLQFD